MTKLRFTSPVGRLVQGDVDEPQTKDSTGAPRVVKSGPNAGQPSLQYYLGVAFPKADERGEFAAFYGQLMQKAAQDFPSLFPNAHAGDYTCLRPDFAFKVIDGDSPAVNQNGRAWNSIEGFPGNWVVRFASGFPPRVFDAGRYGPADQIAEKGFIKRGYWVRISGTMEGNGNLQKPGMYINVDMVERSAICSPDQLITSGPDAGAAFAGGPAALPPGAIPSSAAPPVAGNGAPAAPPLPGAGSSVPASPPVAPPVTPPAPAALAGRTMLPAANGASYEALIAAGWTDETLVANGMMMPAPAAPPSYDGYMAGPTPPGAPAAPVASPPPPAVTTPPLPIASPGSPAPPPAPAAPPPPAAPGRVMLPAANGATYEAMIAAGWTDATLVANGMMAP
jgi:hypothetical protein